ncbi:protein CONSERVED IN THE GREEN LINEAGE AND DIATOMS 27, chloroplastic-like isoform X4 [Coffea arabica]|uniref:Protein CONSERVED IN THE GREEN LINEAGE AND DIATOMS 27, chloroplastic-like isoform X4 n=1 Tax=Coffea arabica TaxID=13443 RepID=A0ABM4V962_COFAR
MLRLSICFSPVPSLQQHKVGSSCRSWIVHYNRHQILSGRTIIRALKDETNGGKNGLPGQSWDPGLEIEVPYEQRPVNEYSSLKDSTLYSWAELGPGSFFLRLGGLWLVTFTVLGVPIAAASFNPAKGWSYVGDRLLSAVIPYEETGWYDGQMWVKPPEVKPVIQLLKQTLVGTGVLLVAAVFLFIFATPVEDFIQNTLSAKENSTEVSVSKIDTKYNIRKEELFRLPVEVIDDDDLAAAAAEAADGRPVYCRDRYYRALAGGQYCKWEDLLK